MTVQNGFAIRAFRNLARLPASHVAEAVGVSEAHYRKIEAETRNANPAQIVAIAKAVNVTPAALVRTPPGQPAVSVPPAKVGA
jgi:transcriptional regulator with XRE-family HTH domain